VSKTDEIAKDFSYLHERLDPLGWTEENNVVVLPAENTGDKKERRYDLFDADAEGNLVINYFRIDGQKAEYKRGDARWGKWYQVLRRRVPVVHADGRVEKYKNPNGTTALPWFPPQVIDAYNNGAPIDTLFLTEGQLKAFKGALHGLMVVGLPGIHNVKDKATGTIHGDIISLIKKCQPRNVVFLHDADCRAFSSKWPEDPAVDLYDRPNSFYTSVRNMGELLKDFSRIYGFKSYYKHLVPDSFTPPPGQEFPKGLDDVLLVYPEAKVLSEATVHGDPNSAPVLPSPARREMLRALAIQELVDDLLCVSGPPRFFERRDMDNAAKLRDYFHLRSVDSFYAAYQERIGEKEFTYDGTIYQWSEDDKEVKVKVPSVAKKYVRVGIDYYKYIKKRNPHTKLLEEELVKWSRPTIVQDHGKTFCDHILKLEAFVNYPDHVAYQRIKDNCLNNYNPFVHVPDPEAEPPDATIGFLKHIFGEGTVRCLHPKRRDANGDAEIIEVNELDLGLDYLKLLYEQPTQMLPILCLVSKERGTGKTTFFNYLQDLFGRNCTFIGAKDLEEPFNSHYASKKVIIIDEALVSKQESVEKLKSMSTSTTIPVNTKGISVYQQAFFGVFLMGSNNIRTFIRTDDDEVRFWVRKIKKLSGEQMDVHLSKKLVEEIPAFLHYLGSRAMATENLFRSWFHPPLTITQALIDVRKHSTPTAKRAVIDWVRDVFWAMPEKKEILMMAKDVRNEVFKGQKIDEKYIREILKEELGLGVYKNVRGVETTTPYSYWRIAEKREGDNIDIYLQEVRSKHAGRPYVFPREQFIPADEEALVERELISPELKKPAPVPAGDDDDDLPF
jgi:hypothetical protein